MTKSKSTSSLATAVTAAVQSNHCRIYLTNLARRVFQFSNSSYNYNSQRFQLYNYSTITKRHFTSISRNFNIVRCAKIKRLLDRTKVGACCGVSCRGINESTGNIVRLRFTFSTNATLNSSSPSSAADEATAQEDSIQMAQSLLDMTKFPLGTFTAGEIFSLKTILHYYKHLDHPTSKESVNHPIDILVRLAQEVAYINAVKGNTGTPKHTNPATTTLTTTTVGDVTGNRDTDIPGSDNNAASYFQKNAIDATSSNVATCEWMLNANYYNSIFKMWKNASLSRENDRIPNIYQGLDMIQKIRYMSKLLPPMIFTVNISTINMVLQVVIQQTRRHEAPIICEKFLYIMTQQLQKQKEALSDVANVKQLQIGRELNIYKPDIYTCNTLLKAWAESRLDNASEKIDHVLREMKDVYNIELGLVSYTILLRFYSRSGDVEKVKLMLQQVHVQQLSIDVDCLAHALSCCCKALQIDIGFTILNSIIQQNQKSGARSKAINDSIHQIILAYRNRIDRALLKTRNGDDDDARTQAPRYDVDSDDRHTSKIIASRLQPLSEVIKDTIERLRELTNIVRTNNLLEHQSLEQMFGMMLDVYVRANLLTMANELVKKELLKSIEAHCILLKAYGENNQVQEATRMLYDLLENIDDPTVPSGVIPNTNMFNIVMEAWRNSKHVDAYEQVYTVFDTLRNHPQCQLKKIRPNLYTYTVLLECILSLDIPDGALEAEAILDEMEKTYNRKFFSDDHTDEVDVDEIVKPDMGIYLDDSDGALKAEAILDDMEKTYDRKFSDDHTNEVDVDEIVKPDMGIYMLVMKLWIHSNDCDRALVILHRMEKFLNIVPNKQMFNELLSCYTNASSEKAAESAEQLFTLMKESFEPQFYAYTLINRAWLKSGSTKAADKLWILYNEMKEKNMRPEPPLYIQLIQSMTSKKEITYIRQAETMLNDLEDNDRQCLVPTHYTVIIMAYLELDEHEHAVEILSKLVYAFGQAISEELVSIVVELINVWIDKRHYKKATILVNAMQEYHDLGLLRNGIQRDTLETLRAGWEASNDPERDCVIAQIDDDIKRLSVPTNTI